MSGVDLPDGRRIRKGAPDAIVRYVKQEHGTIPAGLDAQVKAIASKGATPLVVAEGNRVAGLVVLEDILKSGMRDRFQRLRRMGLRTVMITGDNPLTAAAIAAEAGVDDFLAEATPEAKLAYIRKEQAEGKLVAMMGDGTNDAPALAQADVGVAMNSGTQAAKEAGNMVDLDSDPTKLIETVEIGKQLLMTRGALTTFSIANDLAKYFAIVPAMFAGTLPWLKAADVMNLHSATSAILSAVIFNAVIIPLLIPIALRGVKYRPIGADALLRRNLLIWGLGGVIVPFAGIKLIDMVLALHSLVYQDKVGCLHARVKANIGRQRRAVRACQHGPTAWYPPKLEFRHERSFACQPVVAGAQRAAVLRAVSAGALRDRADPVSRQGPGKPDQRRRGKADRLPAHRPAFHRRRVLPAASFGGLLQRRRLGARNWAASNYLLRDRVAQQLGPIVKYRGGAKKGQLVGPDIELVPEGPVRGPPGHRLPVGQAHSTLAQNWVKADKLNAAHVADWQKTHPAEVAAWVKDNPDNPEPPNPRTLGVPFFVSYSQPTRGPSPASWNTGRPTARPRRTSSRSRKARDIQSVFFDMWLRRPPEPTWSRARRHGHGLRLGPGPRHHAGQRPLPVGHRVAAAWAKKTGARGRNARGDRAVVPATGASAAGADWSGCRWSTCWR